MLNAEEIAYIINHSGSKIFIVEDSLYPIIAKDQDKFSSVEKWGFLPLGDATVPEGFFNLIEEMKTVTYDEPQVDVGAEDIVQIPYTSGMRSGQRRRSRQATAAATAVTHPMVRPTAHEVYSSVPAPTACATATGQQP